ncbi:MAG: type II secretion system inner membrane protein GspF [Nitrospiraceae bacterium]
MPVYHYKGFRSDGAAAGGIVDAESIKVARLKLRKGGVYPTDVVEQGQSASGSATGAGRASSPSGRSASFSAQEIALVTRQLGTLLVAGLPLVEALGILVEQFDKKTAQSTLADIREQIRGGKGFSIALEHYPRDFSPTYVHMVRAGEASGALDQIMFRLAEFLEKQLALKSKVTNAVMYPALMLIVGVTVLFFLVTFVVPKITAVFADLHQALPWPTLVLMSLSGFLSAYWLVLVGGVVAAAAGLQRVLKTPTGRMAADGFLLKLPLMGEVARKLAIARLTSTLATMLASGVQLLDALDVAKRVMNNGVLEQAVEGARQNIREGHTIAEPLKRSGEFPSLVTHMIAVGEKSGEMEEMLRRVSQIYDGEVDRVITRLTSLLEPVMILIMGMLVFFIVVAILLPIFEMGQMVR